jgi:lysophospholipase L1-like esterase
MGHSKGNSYRKDLYDKLVAAGAKVEYVGSQKTGSFPQNSNEGWVGFTIDQISPKADQPQALGAKPNLVLLLAGTNDMTKNPKPAPQKLQKLCEKITGQVSGVVVLIGTIPPITSKYMPGGAGDSAPLIAEYSAAIHKIAKEMAVKKVGVADLSAVKLNNLQDGIHPNDEGYSKMAIGRFKAIEEAASKGWFK